MLLVKIDLLMKPVIRRVYPHYIHTSNSDKIIYFCGSEPKGVNTCLLKLSCLSVRLHIMNLAIVRPLISQNILFSNKKLFS